MKKQITKYIPSWLRPFLKKIYHLLIDMKEQILGRDSMIPPRSMIFIGSGDFIKVGEEFKSHFINLANLKPDEHVLDVGCGIGRMAVPLTSYLSKKGEYRGFDIVKSGIDWCQKNITPRFDNFHFLHSDIYNKHYNPNGKVLAKDYRFPFEEASFDFVFLTSVFTHMLPEDLENYLGEIARVLKPGGRALITFFLMSEESSSLVNAGRCTKDFRHRMNGYFTTDADDPEAAIAYDESVIVDLFAKQGLNLAQPVQYGSWCDRTQTLSYQDIVVATKASA